MTESLTPELFSPILLARIGRFREAIDGVISAKQASLPLSMCEMDCLSLSFGNLVEADRTAAKALSEYLRVIEETSKEYQLTTKFKSFLTDRLQLNCKFYLNFLKPQLDDQKLDTVVRTAVLRDMAEFSRHIAEMDPTNYQALTDTEHYYQLAIDSLPDTPNDPTARLTLIYSEQLFRYELLNKREKALFCLRQEFEDVLAGLEELKLNSYKELHQLLQTIKRTLKDWTKKAEENGGK